MYLQYLEDPSQLVDEGSIAQLEQDVSMAKDPLDKLRAIAALERVRAVDGSTFEEEFIREAKAWADGEGIPVAAFRSMGVPDDVLARAGFEDGRRRGGRATRRSSVRTGRARSTSTDEIQRWVLSTSASFTLADVQQSVGGSPATIKKAIDELTDAGRLENLGPVADHAGRGRAPYHYTLRT